MCIVGDLMREEDVLEWLVQNKNTASEEEDMIEDVTAKTLETLTSTAQHLAVLFCEFSILMFLRHAHDPYSFTHCQVLCLYITRLYP